MIESRERPIIFSGPSVVAIQQDRKTQTRRIVKPQPMHADWTGYMYVPSKGYAIECGPDYPDDETDIVKCPYGVLGDRLWVREAFMLRPGFETISKPHYRADGEKSGWTWQSPLFMFRRDSRLLLEIADIRVQRVQKIDEADAQREGWAFEGLKPNQSYDPVVMDTARQWYRSEWDRINAKRGYPWNHNPWVWAISFKRIPEAQYV